jgi:hypothetical protein
MTVNVTGFDFGQWNESDAITRAQRRDAASFESLYKAHCQHVYHLCLRMLKNVAEAQDLTQQYSSRSSGRSELSAAILVSRPGSTGYRSTRC